MHEMVEEVDRPSFSISREQLEYLMNYGISVPDIAMARAFEKHGFQTYTWVRYFGLSVWQRMTEIFDTELDGIIRDIRNTRK